MLFELLLAKMCLLLAKISAIVDARAEVTRDSDDDTAPPNGFDDILNEVCDEAGYESEESDDEAW